MAVDLEGELRGSNVGTPKRHEATKDRAWF